MMPSFKLDSIEEDISSPTTQKRLLERAQALFQNDDAAGGLEGFHDHGHAGEGH
jgi:hypothetical protein